MNDIPPKQTVSGIPFGSPDSGREAGFNPLAAGVTGERGESGALVSVHQAALHANPDSFPVLKAFQDYLEAERNSARRRVVMLSVFFVSLMVVTIAGLITVGLFVFKNMARQQEAAVRTQDVLLQTLLQQRAAAPAHAAPAPAAPESNPMADALRKLEQKLDARLAAPPPEPAVPERAPADTGSELAKLKETLSAIQAENAKLRSDVSAFQTRKPVVPPAVSAVAAVRPQPAPRQPHVPERTPPVRNEEPVAPPRDASANPAGIAAAPKAPLELPPEGFTRPAPLDGYIEDAVAIPSRVTRDSISWRLLTPTK